MAVGARGTAGPAARIRLNRQPHQARADVFERGGNVGIAAQVRGTRRIVGHCQGGLHADPRRGRIEISVYLPEELRNRLSHLLGAHNVITKADSTKRAEYLDRAEHGKLS